jgi:hypothetical protein
MQNLGLRSLFALISGSGKELGKVLRQCIPMPLIAGKMEGRRIMKAETMAKSPKGGGADSPAGWRLREKFEHANAEMG